MRTIVDRRGRHSWISYLRVSTREQASKELSLPAQRREILDRMAARGLTIEREFEEPGRSATSINRPVFRQTLEYVLRPGSTVAGIVVAHTSRFTRNSTEARIVKSKLRKHGVRVVSVCQDLPDDPMGELMEGLFECVDQYESRINGARSSPVRRFREPGTREQNETLSGARTCIISSASFTRIVNILCAWRAWDPTRDLRELLNESDPQVNFSGRRRAATGGALRRRGVNRGARGLGQLRARLHGEASRSPALDFPAQRPALQTSTSARGAGIACEFVEEGYSGQDAQRPAFRKMLEDVPNR